MLTNLHLSTRSICQYTCRSCLSSRNASIRKYSNQKTLKVSGRRIPSRRGLRKRTPSDGAVSLEHESNRIQLWKKGRTSKQPIEVQSIELHAEGVSAETEGGAAHTTEPKDILIQKFITTSKARGAKKKQLQSAKVPEIDTHQFIKDLENLDGPKKDAQRNALISRAPLEALVALTQSGKLNEKEKTLADMFMKVRLSVRTHSVGNANPPDNNFLTKISPETGDAGLEQDKDKGEKKSPARRTPAAVQENSDGKEKETSVPRIRTSKGKYDVEKSEISAKKADAGKFERMRTPALKRGKHNKTKAGEVKDTPRRTAPNEVYPGEVGGEESMTRKGMKNEKILDLHADELQLVPLEKEQPPVPPLSYGLDRVLFNPGVYSLRDPRSRVYNFDPYLESIMPVSEFDFEALKEYITSSRDEVLISTAKEANRKYTGSTSSMTAALAHFHFLLSQWRPINVEGLSNSIDTTLKTMTALQRAPSAVFLRWRNGVYAIDADKEFDTSNILMMLGKSMEKLLTLSSEEFEKYRKSNSHQITEEQRNDPEAFHYTTMGDFLMRSQLDAHDPRLPGTGMFDLKTRAVVSIRMDAQNYEDGMDYEIRDAKGEYESYEREFYDMIRAAFLKYSLQVRMGRMDGIFVAFHNTQRIFGFQYISLSEMDFTIHGTKNRCIGDSEFKLSVDLLNKVLDRATTKFPEQSLRLYFETRQHKLEAPPFMYAFAEPVTEEQIEAIQKSKAAEVEAFQRKLYGLDKVESRQDGSEAETKDGETSEDSATLVASHEGQLMEDTFDADQVEEDGGDEKAVDDLEGEEDEKAVDDLEGEEDELLNEDEENEAEASHKLEEGLEEEEELDESDDCEEMEKIEAFDAEETEPEEEEFSTETQTETEDPLNDYLAQLSHNFDSSPSHPYSTTSSTPTPEDPATKSLSDYLLALSSNFGTLSPQTPKANPEQKPILAMALSIRNKVNGQRVFRPEKLSKLDKWTVEYRFSEIENNNVAWNTYIACQNRRKYVLTRENLDSPYLEKLKELSKKGREWRRKQNQFDRKFGRMVYGDEKGVVRKEEEGGAGKEDV